MRRLTDEERKNIGKVDMRKRVVNPKRDEKKEEKKEKKKEVTPKRKEKTGIQVASYKPLPLYKWWASSEGSGARKNLTVYAVRGRG